MDFINPDKIVNPKLSRAEIARLAVIVHSATGHHIADHYWKEAASHAALSTKLFDALATSD